MIESIEVPEIKQDPRMNEWTPEETAILRRWYPTMRGEQLAVYWPLLAGRERVYSQIENKARRDGLQGWVPDDMFELFD